MSFEFFLNMFDKLFNFVDNIQFMILFTLDLHHTIIVPEPL